MITVNVFDTIKEMLNIADITKLYGVEEKRNNQELCPFHSEKTTSFTIFPNTNSFNCFGCGVGGSAIDFVMKMYGLKYVRFCKKVGYGF